MVQIFEFGGSVFRYVVHFALLDSILSRWIYKVHSTINRSLDFLSRFPFIAAKEVGS